jgi:glycosyltransferase involved in cell wall biosynthesis
MNSVDPNEFKTGELTPSNEFVIIYNGTIVKLLNLTIIVEAIALLKTGLPPADFDKIVFRLYGDGPALNEILELAEKLGVENKVQYMGYIQPDEMRKQALKANVLILPPIKNIYSDLFYTIKLIETVYLKIPVIATRLSTYKRYYREESLFYFDTGNLNELSERIKEVFYNKDIVKAKTENARSDYDKIGWDIMKQKYIAIIKNIL